MPIWLALGFADHLCCRAAQIDLLPFIKELTRGLRARHVAARRAERSLATRKPSRVLLVVRVLREGKGRD